MAALSHPNVLALHDIGAEGDLSYVVMELVEGSTLRERLADGPLSSARAVPIAIQIAHGLAAAHDRGVVHRDLKPENVIVTPDGRAKILDFGLARLETPAGTGSQSMAPTRAAGTEPGMVLGTVGYMSPEQVRGQVADARSDLFALGVVLYEMLSGRRAFHADSPAETMSAILREDPPELASLVPNVSPSIERIVRRCLEKQPVSRFRSAADLAFALEARRKEIRLMIMTARLMLMPTTVAMARAELCDRDAFARLLPGSVPGNWPPESTIDALPLFLSWLEAAPDRVGWFGWYALT